MPFTQMDIDDEISQGDVDVDKWQAEEDGNFTKPYDKARAEATWYSQLQQMFGVPGKMAEQKLQETNKARYDKAKQVFIDGMLGGKTNVPK